ncbi:porin family protein [Flagellimonas eckloniae]|uniref:Outer membrane insertion c-terminal signal protein n=1 Tax=Flagellimonas eckloniae TaxID=346185 RepID=A0A0Q0XG39_9FLAO|nr:porin family protein [Allomuricauda eckloniae]KQC30058.1 outer membrane insertion c-terminal signal protein [Allomuricauda eckloniae]
MRNYLFLLCYLLFCLGIKAQESPKAVEDDKYLEDQFYVGLGFNLLLEKPSNIVQSSLSYSVQTGFIKDIPFNQKRNFGLGLGLGYATNSYYSNIGASKTDNVIAYEVLTSDYKRSKFETHAIEIPLELRWRTSTVDEYKFWRIYAGVKLGYVFSGRSKLVTDSNTTAFSNDDIQNLQYGLQLNFGYNTWNIHAYYGLNPLLKDDVGIESGELITMGILRIGVIFYIL